MSDDRSIMIEKMINLIRNGNADLQVPVKFQLGLLGLDDWVIENLPEGRGLDIGCGDGSLVHYLIERGVDFEGIDSAAPEGEAFMKQNIYGMHPMEGCIPRRDESYDIVVSFQNPELNHGLNVTGRELREHPFVRHNYDNESVVSMLMRSQFIVFEAARVLKKGGRAVFYPEVNKIEEIMGSMIRMEGGMEIGREKVDATLAKTYIDMEFERSFGGLKVNLPEELDRVIGMYSRTVLTKY